MQFLKCQFKVTGSPIYFLFHGSLLVFLQERLEVNQEMEKMRAEWYKLAKIDWFHL